MNNKFAAGVSLAIAGLLALGLTGCAQPAGPSPQVMAALQKNMQDKARSDRQFASWVRSSGKYTAADLDGRWEWQAGVWDAAGRRTVFVDTGARIQFKYDSARPGSVDFDIKNDKRNPKGTAVLNTGEVPTLTFFTAAAEPAKTEAAGIPAGYYVAMYVVHDGQSGLILWDPARDAFFQARRVPGERFRGLGDEGDGTILPELPPAQGPSVPPVGPGPGPAPAVPTPNPNPPTPGPVVPEPQPQPPVVLPPVKPVSSMVGAWKVVSKSPVETYIVFTADSYEIYVACRGNATLIDTGVYALQGNQLSSRSNVTGEVTVSTLQAAQGIVTMASKNGIIKVQRVR